MRGAADCCWRGARRKRRRDRRRRRACGTVRHRHGGRCLRATVLEAFGRTHLLGSPTLMRRFATRDDVPGSSRALGWDTMLPTSSCGTLMSATAIGHTGFTGTSLWIDHERDVYVVLLTNRVHPT